MPRPYAKEKKMRKKGAHGPAPAHFFILKPTPPRPPPVWPPPPPILHFPIPIPPPFLPSPLLQNRSPKRTHAAPAPVLASVAYSSRTAPALTPAPREAPLPGRR